MGWLCCPSGTDTGTWGSAVRGRPWALAACASSRRRSPQRSGSTSWKPQQRGSKQSWQSAQCHPIAARETPPLSSLRPHPCRPLRGRAAAGSCERTCSGGLGQRGKACRVAGGDGVRKQGEKAGVGLPGVPASLICFFPYFRQLNPSALGPPLALPLRSGPPPQMIGPEGQEQHHSVKPQNPTAPQPLPLPLPWPLLPPLPCPCPLPLPLPPASAPAPAGSVSPSSASAVTAPRGSWASGADAALPDGLGRAPGLLGAAPNGTEAPGSPRSLLGPKPLCPRGARQRTSLGTHRAQSSPSCSGLCGRAAVGCKAARQNLKSPAAACSWSRGR